MEESAVISVAFSPDGSLLAAGSEDGLVRVWQAPAGRLLRVLTGHEHEVWGIAFSPPPESKAAPRSHIERVSLILNRASYRAARLLERWMPRSLMIRFILREELLLATGDEDGRVCLWRARDGSLLRVMEKDESEDGPGVWALAFSAAARLLAVVDDKGGMWRWPFEQGQTTRYRVYPESLSPPDALSAGVDGVCGLALSPFQDVLAAGRRDDTVEVRRVEDGQRLTVLQSRQGWVWSLAFSPDGRLLATASDDGVICLWDVTRQTGEGQEARQRRESLRTLREHKGQIGALAFAPDGSTLASAGQDGVVRLWRVPDGQLLRALACDCWVTAVAFSGDGRRLASASEDGVVRLWKISDGRLIGAMQS